MNIKTMMLASAIIATGLLPGAVVCAHADTTDDVFLEALYENGIGENFSASSKIAAAHSVCAGFAKGYDAMTIANDMANSNGMTIHDMGFFIGASTASYCPQYNVSQPTHLNHAV